MRSFAVRSSLVFHDPLEVGRTLCLYPDLMSDLFGDNSFRQWLIECDRALAEEAIQAFSSVSDEQFGLFKASYVLAPEHPLIFMGSTYASTADFGLKILKGAPDIDPAALRFFDSGALVWYLERKRFDVRDQSRFAAVMRVYRERASDVYTALFRIGYILSKSTSIFFEGKEYRTIQDFFLRASEDDEVLSRVDMITAPFSIAYHLENGLADQLRQAQSRARTAEREEEILVRLRK